ncbi:uncharacterized protein SPPG_07141 [Spizellomyces punctatus DAOM BR117]|uniref:CENP-C homolog n=1 Tax=Spizellomyces punctatus (strain DAOM BR117) TaxID=645134 RepID=A0A0L0H916_SPIPD|nr:uncharacterized protein SPPG_07141 [Spizellomyces punctatus DAOM BR117]KNC97677.1 hypothetical protein SPPG_07141 [Spizellomyces punctatus DAOM BR117]|eukprot:XP_016605717.1 hypothetical protein SPPG_07141 [Spizellomyces punctatus DAOM BR117]
MLTEHHPAEADADVPGRKARWQKDPRPNNYHEVGVKGRKTGVTAPKNVQTDANGLMSVDDWFREDEDETDEITRGPREGVSGRMSTPSKPKYAKADSASDVEPYQQPPRRVSPATGFTKEKTPGTATRNAISRLPRPSMLEGPLDTATKHTPQSQRSSKGQFSNISSAYIVDEDMPSPRTILSPAAPLRLEHPVSETTPKSQLDDRRRSRTSGSLTVQLPQRTREPLVEGSKTSRKSVGGPSSFIPSRLSHVANVDMSGGDDIARGAELLEDGLVEYRQEEAFCASVTKTLTKSSENGSDDGAGRAGSPPSPTPEAITSKKGIVREDIAEPDEENAVLEGKFNEPSSARRSRKRKAAIPTSDAESDRDIIPSMRQALPDSDDGTPLRRGNAAYMVGTSRTIRRGNQPTQHEYETSGIIDEPILASARKTTAKHAVRNVHDPDDSEVDTRRYGGSARRNLSEEFEKSTRKAESSIDGRSSVESREDVEVGHDAALEPIEAVDETQYFADANEVNHEELSDEGGEKENEIKSKRHQNAPARKGKQTATRTRTRKAKQPRRELPPEVTDAVFQLDDQDEDENGARRSKRMKIKPLKYWAGERVVIGRRESGFFPVPVVKEVIRVKSDDESSNYGKGKPTTRVKSEPAPLVQPDVPVINITTGQEENQRIVATPEMLNPRTIGAGDYKFQKVFSEGEFIASGILVMPKGSQKPNKNSNQSAMIFYVVSGEVEVQIHKTIFVVKTGSQFFVPRGNQYRIQNVASREAKLFFCHGKEVLMEAPAGQR